MAEGQDHTTSLLQAIRAAGAENDPERIGEIFGYASAALKKQLAERTPAYSPERQQAELAAFERSVAEARTILNHARQPQSATASPVWGNTQAQAPASGEPAVPSKPTPSATTPSSKVRHGYFRWPSFIFWTISLFVLVEGVARLGYTKEIGSFWFSAAAVLLAACGYAYTTRRSTDGAFGWAFTLFSAFLITAHYLFPQIHTVVRDGYDRPHSIMASVLGGFGITDWIAAEARYRSLPQDNWDRRVYSKRGAQGISHVNMSLERRGANVVLRVDVRNETNALMAGLDVRMYIDGDKGIPINLRPASPIRPMASGRLSAVLPAFHDSGTHRAIRAWMIPGGPTFTFRLQYVQAASLPFDRQKNFEKEVNAWLGL